MITVNYYERAKAEPEIFTQLMCKKLLFVHYKCPPMDRFFGKWSQHSHILYILAGKLAYHTPEQSWSLTSGTAVFIKKGAAIVEKLIDEELCIMTFFIPDSYLCSFIREYHTFLKWEHPKELSSNLIIPLAVTEVLRGYFNSLIPYFTSKNTPSEDLLELKFRELLFNIITDPLNKELGAYLKSLLSPRVDYLQNIMEANCLFNLRLQDYAKLCNRSLSSFKRDFYAVYQENPGQWLLSKKLNYSHHLLITTDKPINDISFESGFKNSTHFIKTFKKRYGLPPLQYKHKVKLYQIPHSKV